MFHKILCATNYGVGKKISSFLKEFEIQFFENNISRHRLINFEFIKDEIGVSKTFLDYYSQMEVLLAIN